MSVEYPDADVDVEGDDFSGKAGRRKLGSLGRGFGGVIGCWCLLAASFNCC